MTANGTPNQSLVYLLQSIKPTAEAWTESKKWHRIKKKREPTTERKNVIEQMRRQLIFSAISTIKAFFPHFC